MRRFPECSAATLVCLLAATPVVAQSTAPAPAGTPALSIAAVAGALARAALNSARMVADVRYGSLQVDAPRGTLTIRDLRVAGLGPNRECRVSVGRLQLSGLSVLAWDDAMQSRLDAGDISIANNCFGARAAMIGLATGGPAIEIATLAVDSRQSNGSGAAALVIEAVAPGMARIEASGDFAYLSLSAPAIWASALQDDEADGEDEDDEADAMDDGEATAPQFGLRGTLNHAHLAVEDMGLWARLSPLLPPEALDPATLDGLVTAPPGTALAAFQGQFAAAAKGFVAQPGRLTIEVRPPRPVDFDSTEWSDPEPALALFAPQVTNAAPTPPVALIADPADASDPRRLGLALATGRGIPQDRRRALDLLQPLAGDPEIDFTLADLLVGSDPARGYALARGAAARQVDGAAARMDAIETMVPTPALLAAQGPADAPVPDAAFASTVALRDAALALERGETVARSYPLAWRLGSLAAARGDAPAQALLDRLEARFGNDPAWIQARDAAASRAAADWSERGLGREGR